MDLEASGGRDRIAAALETIRAKAAHQGIESITEAATKAQFVEPLFHAMGFTGLDDIGYEHHVQASGEWIDYVLKVAGHPAVAVEAKSFGTELIDKYAAQVVKYAAIEGIEWCLLTNGREMSVFNEGLKGDLGAKHVVDIDLLAEHPADALDVLTLFSKEGMANQANLKGWMREAVLNRTLRLVVLDSQSSTTIQLAETARDKTGLGLTSEDVSRWFSRILGLAPPPELIKPRKEKRASAEVSYWLVPARPRAEGSSVEALQCWLNAGMWGMRRSTPGRKSMKDEDIICFYATGTGVVASSEIAGSADALVTAKEWPEPHEMEHEVFKVPLRGTQWLPKPILIDEGLRSRLDAFKGQRASPIWGWFVGNTSKLSERDFNLLVGRASPQ